MIMWFSKTKQRTFRNWNMFCIKWLYSLRVNVYSVLWSLRHFYRYEKHYKKVLRILMVLQKGHYCLKKKT